LAGAAVVEMEAAALYAFGRARNLPIVCVAHVTNQMAQNEGDFAKGPADGAEGALRFVGAIAISWFLAEPGTVDHGASTAPLTDAS